MEVQQFRYAIFGTRCRSFSCSFVASRLNSRMLRSQSEPSDRRRSSELRGPHAIVARDDDQASVRSPHLQASALGRRSVRHTWRCFVLLLRRHRTAARSRSLQRKNGINDLPLLLLENAVDAWRRRCERRPANVSPLLSELCQSWHHGRPRSCVLWLFLCPDERPRSAVAYEYLFDCLVWERGQFLRSLLVACHELISPETQELTSTRTKAMLSSILRVSRSLTRS